MSNSKGTILCMDDEEMIRITIGDFLEDCGYEVHLARDGKEGLRMYREKSPDLLLVDLRMPEMNGLDVLTIVARESPLTPVIVVSGTGILRDAIEAIRLGAWNYLTKPIEDMTFLEHTVKEALEKSRLQRENIQYRENLEKMVFERTQALQKANRQLRQAQKMEAIGTLAGGIAHDFNNILSSVIGFTELALDEAEKGTDMESSLHEVLAAGNRARDLVKQILTFARESEGEVKPTDVGIIAREVLKFIRSSIPVSIEIRQDITCKSLILSDPTRIHQILMNLCTNAAQAMEQDGGILTVSLSDTTLDEDFIRQHEDLILGNYIELSVSDMGTGMTEETIDAIFEPYFTTKPSGEGTGLGLAVVHGIVKTCGGEITVESREGEGSVFTVYLPAISRSVPPETPETKDLPSGTERILFVDDESPIVKMGKQNLENLGYAVTIRTDSREALELFRLKPDDFDLVITDMTMPHMNGDKLAVELLKIRPRIPIILCTGYSKKISEETAERMGLKAFVFKPVVRTDLAGTVRRVLDGNV